MAKISRPVLYGGIAAIAIAAFILTSDEEPATKAATSRPKAKAPARAQATIFTEEDYSVRFVALNSEVKNSFKPLVVRAPSASFSGPAFDDRQVPADIAGEGTWVYTGMAEVDGVPMALVENRTNGDTRFLQQGERWSSASVYRITPESLVLLHRGELFTIKMQGLEEPVANPGFAPMQVPPGSLPGGQIGRGQMSVVPEQQQQQSANEGRRRRNNPGAPMTSTGNDPMIGEWFDEN
jgi:hypothetical protein